MQTKVACVFLRTEKKNHELIKKKIRTIIQMETGAGMREETTMPAAKLEARKRKGKVIT